MRLGITIGRPCADVGRAADGAGRTGVDVGRIAGDAERTDAAAACTIGVVGRAAGDAGHTGSYKAAGWKVGDVGLQPGDPRRARAATGSNLGPDVL
jgi:hypothetical protein